MAGDMLSLFSPKSDLKSMHFFLCFVTGSSSYPNLPNCSPRESISVYANCLRSLFSASQPKALRSRASGYLSDLRQATCPEESHSSFCSHLPCFPVFLMPWTFLQTWLTCCGSLAQLQTYDYVFYGRVEGVFVLKQS